VEKLLYANQTTLPLSHLLSTLALLLGYGKWFFHSLILRNLENAAEQFRLGEQQDDLTLVIARAL